MVSEKIPHANKNYRCHFGKTFKAWYMVILTDTDIQTIPKVFLHISRECGFTCGKHRNSQTAVVNTSSWHRHSAVSLPDCEEPVLCNNYLVTSQFYWTMQVQPHLSRTGWYAETSLAEQDGCVLLQLWAPCSVHSDVANVALLACLAVQHRPSSITHTHAHTHMHTLHSKSGQPRQHNWITWIRENITQQQQQPFHGPLSGTTRVSRYQKKKRSPTHHPDHHPIFISFFHLSRSIASSLFKLRTWQSFCTTLL